MVRNHHSSRKAGRPNPRALALATLGKVLQGKLRLDEALKLQQKQIERLDSRDKAFLRLLVTVTLRQLGLIDRVLKACLDHPLSNQQLDVKNIIRLSIAQLLYLETPPHAAVSTALKLAEAHPRNRAFKNLINAILRRIAEEGKRLLQEEDPESCAVPPWFWNRLSENYGEEKARAIVRQQLQEPPLDLSLKADHESWAKKLGGKLLPNGSLRLPAGRGDPTLLEGYNEGAWWVQDCAASLPAKLFGSLHGKDAADLCAAPGGKTIELILAGAKVTAVDISQKRLKRLEENLARLKLRAEEIIATDIRKWQSDKSFDAILLDAPCSATGTLRRHPELIRIRKPGSIDELAAIQSPLLEATWQKLKPGGVLVYSACSLEPEEGQDQIALFLANKKGKAERKAITAEELASLCHSRAVDDFAPLVTAQGDLRCLPSHWDAEGGMDGFFACRIVKIAGS